MPVQQGFTSRAKFCRLYALFQPWASREWWTHPVGRPRGQVRLAAAAGVDAVQAAGHRAVYLHLHAPKRRCGTISNWRLLLSAMAPRAVLMKLARLAEQVDGRRVSLAPLAISRWMITPVQRLRDFTGLLRAA
jgi:hypothetical protein